MQTHMDFLFTQLAMPKGRLPLVLVVTRQCGVEAAARLRGRHGQPLEGVRGHGAVEGRVGVIQLGEEGVVDPELGAVRLAVGIGRETIPGKVWVEGLYLCMWKDG